MNTVSKDIQYFSCSNYKADTRGACESRHYIRADAVKQAVMPERNHHGFAFNLRKRKLLR